jgi:hypothetical protein
MKSYAKTTFARATALAVLLSIALGTNVYQYNLFFNFRQYWHIYRN